MPTPPLAAMNPKTDLVCVIMAGGAGTRFWPASTEARPKQFLRLAGERTLLQQAYDRVAPVVGPERVLVLTSARFVDICREQLPELSSDNVVGEPMRRDTAAAVALAAVLIEHRFGDVVQAVLTSDHIIGPADVFQHTLLSAARGAATGEALYTFGVVPDRPATGYGYLELGAALGQDGDVEHFELARFVEKPDLATAQRYVAGDGHLWNSGMFVWRTARLVAELKAHLPAHLDGLRAAMAGAGPLENRLAAAFEPLEKVSVDYGIMEKASAVRCVRAPFSWSDVGGFPALAPHLRCDDANNAHNGSLIAMDAANNIVFCDDDDETVALLGVEGLVVVRSQGRTLVMPAARAEELKKLVQGLPESLK